MRITRSGAACSRQRDHTPSASSALTDGAIRAVVRLSTRLGGGATSTVGTPKCASASAVTRPAGPPPITAAEVVCAEGRGDAGRSVSEWAVIASLFTDPASPVSPVKRFVSEHGLLRAADIQELSLGTSVKGDACSCRSCCFICGEGLYKTQELTTSRCRH